MPEKQMTEDTISPFKIKATAAGLIAEKAGGIPRPIQVSSNDVFTDAVKIAVKVSADQTLADAGDRIQYTVLLKNDSSVDLYDAKIMDKICTKTILSKDSITPAPQPGEILETGVSVTGSGETLVGSVPKGKSAALRYEVTVKKGETGDIVDCAAATVKFKDQKDSEYTCKTDPSFAVASIVAANLQITASADKTFVTENNEAILFTLIVANTGNVKISNVVVTSPFPAGMHYKPGSTVKTGTDTFTDEDPADSIPIGDLDPMETYKIQFGVTVSL